MKFPPVLAMLVCVICALASVDAGAEPRYNHQERFALGGRAGWYRGARASDPLLRGVGAMGRYQWTRRLGVGGSVGLFEVSDPGTCTSRWRSRRFRWISPLWPSCSLIHP